ncbi:hypothetical protein NHX12_005976, partial [Muraenolepis orangiensis]
MKIPLSGGGGDAIAIHRRYCRGTRYRRGTPRNTAEHRGTGADAFPRPPSRGTPPPPCLRSTTCGTALLPDTLRQSGSKSGQPGSDSVSQSAGPPPGSQEGLTDPHQAWTSDPHQAWSSDPHQAWSSDPPTGLVLSIPARWRNVSDWGHLEPPWCHAR